MNVTGTWQNYWQMTQWQEKRQREQEQNRILGGGGSMQPFPSTEGTPKDIFTKGLFKFFGK